MGMKKKGFLLSAIIATAGVVWGMRFWYLNNHAQMPVTETYQMNEVVEYGDNFFNRSGELREGYAIEVKNAKILTYDEFKQKYDITPPEKAAGSYCPEFVVDLEVTIFNRGTENEECGIDLFNTLFTSSCIRMPIDLDLWSSLYPQLGGSDTFRLRENSSMDFHLPYIVENESDARIADRDYMLDRPWYLNISLYPVKKRIEIVLCEQ